MVLGGFWVAAREPDFSQHGESDGATRRTCAEILQVSNFVYVGLFSKSQVGEHAPVKIQENPGNPSLSLSKS